MILFEHERLCIGDTLDATSDGPTFTQELYDKIDRWKKRTNHPGLTVGNRFIKATQWAGVLQVGAVTIEILPKAEADRGEAERDKLVVKWKSILLGMIAALHQFDLRTEHRAHLKLQNRTLLDVFFHLFVAKTEGLLREGLVKTYRQVERNRSAWRGRLVVAKDLTRNLVHKERVYTAALEFDVHNPWNRILVAALRVVARHAHSSSLRAQSRGLLLPFEEWSFPAIQSQDFERLRFDRRTERYRDAIDLAKLVLLRQNPDLKGGSEDVFALLFDMNVLWEAWVADKIRRELKKENRGDWQLRTQSSKLFWDSPGGGRKTVRSDLILIPLHEQPVRLALFNEAVVVTSKTVLDTKWKVLTSAVPSDADLKQMFVYNKLWKAEHSLLIYPKVHLHKQQHGNFYADHGRDSACGLAFVEVGTGSNALTSKMVDHGSSAVAGT